MSMRWFDVCFSDFRLEKTLLRSLSLSLAEAVLLLLGGLRLVLPVFCRRSFCGLVSLLAFLAARRAVLGGLRALLGVVLGLALVHLGSRVATVALVCARLILLILGCRIWLLRL